MKMFVATGVLALAFAAPAVAQQVYSTYAFDSSGQITGSVASGSSSSSSSINATGFSDSSSRMEIQVERDTFGLQVVNGFPSGERVVRRCTEEVRSDAKRYLMCEK